MAELRRTIGAFRGSTMMLNIVLGAGVLTLPGLAIEAAGGAALWVWLACAGVAAPLLIVFAVIGRRFPDPNGISAIASHAFGQFGYVTFALLFLGAVAVGLPSIALVGGHYAAGLLGGAPSFYAFGFILVAGTINLLSPERAGRINAIVASTLIVVLIAIVVVGFSAVPVDPSVFSTAALSGLLLDQFLAAFMIVFFAFTGWEVGASLSGEFRNPERDYPRALAVSFTIAVALYLALAVLAQSADFAGAYAAPFAAIFSAHFGPAGAIAISAAAIALIFANLSAAVWAVSRAVFGASRDGLLPRGLSTTRHGTPVMAIVMTVIVLLGVSEMVRQDWLDLGQILGAAGQNFLIIYGASAAALFVLSRDVGARFAAALAVGIVVGLLALRGPAHIAYPALLIVAAALIAWRSLSSTITAPDATSVTTPEKSITERTGVKT